MATLLVPQSEPTTAALELPEQPWVAIVANPFSGAGANKRLVEKFCRSLQSQGMTSLAIWDKAERDALLHHPLLTRWCCCIVVAGGDGTVADVLNHRPAVPIAVLPLGNENLLAKQFGFTAGIDELAKAILRGRYTNVDLGLFGDRCFSLMLTAGIDGDLVHRVAAWRSRGGKMRRVRHWSYFPPFLSSVQHFKYPQVTLTAGDREVTGSLAMVFNLPRYGLNLPIAPDAVGDDGLLDYVVFQKPGIMATFQYLYHVVRGQHRSLPDVITGRASHIKLDSHSRSPIQMDGDPAGHTPAEITVAPKAIRIVRA